MLSSRVGIDHVFVPPRTSEKIPSPPCTPSTLARLRVRKHADTEPRTGLAAIMSPHAEKRPARLCARRTVHAPCSQARRGVHPGRVARHDAPYPPRPRSASHDATPANTPRSRIPPQFSLRAPTSVRITPPLRPRTAPRKPARFAPAPYTTPHLVSSGNVHAPRALPSPPANDSAHAPLRAL
ncbi:hypothetical protein B0H17DRAFT_1328882 [Mycena rosella]|uniref:Uncharacterized protein n=1 Tax=Mycena rosella TaxID=1033263 RepID=A0AAD7GNH6_MYCRO|nr:hypothetical protein B0H17DRAFT_1328882 [Mycena rosella]